MHLTFDFDVFFIQPVVRSFASLTRSHSFASLTSNSPNQVLTHAAAKQLNKVPFQAPLVAARAKGSGQSNTSKTEDAARDGPCVVKPARRACARGSKFGPDASQCERKNAVLLA